MGIAENIRQLFNGPGQQQPGQQNNMPNQNIQNPGGTPQTNIPGQQNQLQQGSNDPNKQTSPLDAYAALFQTPDPVKQQNTPKAPEFTLDPKIISQAANNIDFTTGLPDEVRQAFSQSPNADVLTQVVSHAARQAYTAAIQHMSSLTGRFVDMRSSFDQGNIGSHVKEHIAKNSLSSTFGNANPVAQQGLNMVSDLMRKSFPDASPDWIAKNAPEFFVEVAKAIAPDKFKPVEGDTQNQNSQNFNNPKNPEVTDWSNWLLNSPGPKGA